MKTIVRAIALCSFALSAAACTAPTSTSVAPPTDVALSLADGARVVTVSGVLHLGLVAPAGDVIWRVVEPNGGSVAADGTYTAPDVPGDYHVEVASAVAPDAIARARVHVVAHAAVHAVVLPKLLTVGRAASAHADLNPGDRCAWSAINANLLSGGGTDSAAFEPSGTGDVTVTCVPRNEAGEDGAPGGASAKAVDAPAIATFTADRDLAMAFDTVGLRFSTGGGKGVITPGNLAADGEGSVFVKPGTATTYTLTVTGADGSSVQRTTHVDVTPAGQLVVQLAGDVPARPQITIGTPDARTLTMSGPFTLGPIAPGTYSVFAYGIDELDTHYTVAIDDLAPVVTANASKVVTITFTKVDFAPSIAPIADAIVVNGAPPVEVPLPVSDPTGDTTAIAAYSLTPSVLPPGSVAIQGPSPQNASLVLTPAGTRGRALVRIDLVGGLGTVTSRVVRVTVGDVAVTSLADAGPGSLREALTNASTGNAIVFAPSAYGTIALASTLTFPVNVQLLGPGADRTTIDGNDAFSVLTVGARSVVIEGLTLAHGHAKGAGTPRGGAILGAFPADPNALTPIVLRDVELRDNASDGTAGAIFAPLGGLLVERCTFANNRAAAAGGAIHVNNNFHAITIRQSTFDGNTVTAGNGVNGAAIASYSAVNIRQSTITNNKVVSPLPSTAGGGVAVLTTGAAVAVAIDQTILADNTVQGGTTSAPDLYLAPNVTLTSGGFNVIGAGDGLALDASTDKAGSVAAPLASQLDPLALSAPGTTRTRRPSLASPAYRMIPAGLAAFGADQNGVFRSGAASAGAAERP